MFFFYDSRGLNPQRAIARGTSSAIVPADTDFTVDFIKKGGTSEWVTDVDIGRTAGIIILSLMAKNIFAN